MYGMATNMSDSWATSITIWEPAMSGLWLNHGGLIVFMDGKEAIRIGVGTPPVTIVTGQMRTGMCSRDTTQDTTQDTTITTEKPH
jgi:hypothetical protein